MKSYKIIVPRSCRFYLYGGVRRNVVLAEEILKKLLKVENHKESYWGLCTYFVWPVQKFLSFLCDGSTPLLKDVFFSFLQAGQKSYSKRATSTLGRKTPSSSRASSASMTNFLFFKNKHKGFLKFDLVHWLFVVVFKDTGHLW